MRHVASGLATAALLAVFAAACGGSASTPVSSKPVFPSLRANGLIAFSIGRKGQLSRQGGGLYVMNPSGKGLRRLTRSTGLNEDGYPAWSPDGTQIAFLRGVLNHGYAGSQPPDRADIYCMKTSGGSPRRLTRGLRTFNFAWSPNGRKIAYAAGTLNGFLDFRVYLMRADGSGKRVLTGEGAQNPVWSPDGRRIAFKLVDDDLKWSLYVMSSDGRHRSQLTPKGHVDPLQPFAWSPDGSTIAFWGTGSGISVVNADGSGLHLLTTRVRAESGPYWSPDGRRIAFVGGASKIYVMNADGSGLRVVTKRVESFDGLTWSPDGEKIAYVLDRSLTKPYENDIHIVNADGRGDRRVRNAMVEEGLSWQPRRAG